VFSQVASAAQTHSLPSRPQHALRGSVMVLVRCDWVNSGQVGLCSIKLGLKKKERKKAKTANSGSLNTRRRSDSPSI
jgi:hypothetical protein